MTLHAVYTNVRTGKREVGVVMIKCIVCAAIGVTRQAIHTVVDIAADADMFLVGLRVGVARDTGKDGEIARLIVTFRTLRPYPEVIPAVDREVLSIMIK